MTGPWEARSYDSVCRMRRDERTDSAPQLKAQHQATPEEQQFSEN